MNRKGPGRPWSRRRTDNKSKQQQTDHTSFHRRNFCIIAAPLLFIFSVLRTIVIQLWLVLGILVCKGSAISGRNRQGVTYRPHRDAESGLGMSKAYRSPGPGDPLLVTQKHHHRKAFEYISKALKIDEEDGEY